ncbi:PAS domain S-box protein [Pontibacter mangrovi]|uniref:histidine kinase n=2 Tax=Pontibacter mangrovi TaxID=2589816 RepID=A0A501W1K5_9BACT|nr:PAS domain S-box protein [Pontibacter mangrovi]
MGQLMRSFDWENHPLGSPQKWPESLKTNIRLLLNSSFPMFIWWTNDLYMFHNDAYLPALGNKHPKALGASAREMWREIWGDLGKVVDGILEGGTPFYAEALMLMLERKGFAEETYWTFSYSPAFDSNGAVNGIFCACHEVTSTVLSERRLKTLKEISEVYTQIHTMKQASQFSCDILLRNSKDLPFSLVYLLNNTATSATRIGMAGCITEAYAPQTLSLTKPGAPWPLAEALSSKTMQLVDCAPLHLLATQEGNSEKLIQAAVLPIIRPGQNQVIGFLVAGISPWLEFDNKYKGFLTLIANHIGTTVTSVQAREELARQQAYLQEVFLQAPVGICILRGPQHIIDLANPGVCEIWGRKPVEVLHKPVIEALPEVAEQGIIELLDKVVNTGEPFVATELPLQLERNGKMEKVYLNFLYHPMYDPQGFIAGVIAVAIDISEQVKYRQSVEELNNELMATNADLDNFVYSASHDLKAPISNIEGLMEALLEYLPEETLNSAPVKRITDYILNSLNRFKRAVTDLTDVTRIQRQAGDDVGSIRLSEVVNEVLLDFDMQLQETNATVEKNLDDTLTVHFSGKNIRSVVYNLISNAIKYRSPDRQLHLRITTIKTPQHTVFSVQDNGLGLNMQKENKIFSMFKRLHDHVEGSGVGLYIVKRIVENAGGSIKVESEEGVGSTFSVYFRQ